MLKRGDILRHRVTGRYRVVRKIYESSSPGYFWLISLKVRKDGVSWGNDSVELVTRDKPIPWRNDIVPLGQEPEAIRLWRE